MWHKVTSPQTAISHRQDLLGWFQILKRPESIYSVYKPTFSYALTDVLCGCFLDSCSSRKLTWHQEAVIPTPAQVSL